MEINTILEQAKKDGIQLVELHFTDIHGNLKSVTIPVEKLKDALHRGIWFDGSSIEGFTRIFESDMYLKPDAETYAIVPWKKEVITARFICDVFTPDGEPFEGDPRYILRQAVKKAEALGYDYKTGPELEFFLFKGNGHSTELHDTAGYFDFSPRDLAGEFRKDVIFSLSAFGIETEMSHHEVAPGQHEIDFKYGSAVRTADHTITLKYVIKSIAHIHGLYASFMPKPVQGICGSGMHVHQSLYSIKDKKNAFFDEHDPYQLSELAKQFIAGQLCHAQALTAIVSPTVNSYKRLVPGYEAPAYVCWARRNRSALIRIPRIFKDMGEASRCELRCPDPSSNPYLAFAAMLHAGLDGIQNKMKLPPPVEENVYQFTEEDLEKKGISMLPGSLWAAIQKLQKDPVVLNSLGSHTQKIYLQAKKEEWDSYRQHVTSWEHDRYFKIV